MTDTRIQLFDGTTLAFPQGTAQDVIDRVAKQETFARKAVATNAAQARDGVSGGSLMQAGIDPTEGNSFAQNFLIGAGKAISDTGHGIKQLVADAGEYISPTERNLSSLITGNQPESWAQQLRRETDETKQRDEPLMNTGGGVVGNIVGNVGMALTPGGFLKGAAAIQGARGAMGAAKALNAAGGALIVPRTILGAGAQGATLAAIQPVGTDDERSVNALIGGAAGAAIPAVITGYRGAKSLIDPLTSTGQAQILGRALQEASGGDANLLAKLRGAQELVPGSMPTVGEAANNASIAALQRSAFASTPEVKNAVVERQAAQNTARVGELLDLAGTPQARQAAIELRDEETKALRDAGLKNANYGTEKTAELTGRIEDKSNSIVSALRDTGRLKTIEAEQGVLAKNYTPVEGQPVLPRYVPNAERIPEAAAAASDTIKIEAQRKAERGFLERQLNSLQASGYSPLQVKGITSGIDGVLNQPGIRASDVVRKTVGSVREKLTELADKAGNIDARDLYTVRKEIGNTISTFAKESGNWDKKLTSGLERDIQKSMDAAIEKAGAGDLWTRYLSKYQELSKPINAMDTAAEIGKRSISGINDKLTPAAFARALRDETAQSATGFNKATLANTLEPQQLTRLNAIKEDLKRADFAANAGRSGSDTVEKLAYNNMLAQTGVPNFLRNFAPTQFMGNLANSGANLLYGNANKTLQKQLAQALLDPKEAAKLLEAATPSQRGKLLATILRGTATQAAIAAPASRN